MKKLKMLLAILVTIVMLSALTTGFAETLRIELNPRLDYLILVNDDHPYEFGGEYDEILTEKDENGKFVAMFPAPDTTGVPTLVEKATYDAFVRLQGELAKRGLLIQLFSGYRSQEDQKWLVDTYKDNPPIWWVGGEDTSGHLTGLELWIYVWDVFEGEEFMWGAETQERAETISRFKILHELMPDYGFIDRYPAGKEDWTGVSSEPYEIRFVGSPVVAHEIMDNGLCLEEYLANK